MLHRPHLRERETPKATAASAPLRSNSAEQLLPQSLLGPSSPPPTPGKRPRRTASSSASAATNNNNASSIVLRSLVVTLTTLRNVIRWAFAMMRQWVGGMGWVDGVFLLLVSVGLWRMSLVGHKDHHHNLALAMQDYSSSSSQQKSLLHVAEAAARISTNNLLEVGGTVPFYGTRDCNNLLHHQQQNNNEDEQQSNAFLCQVHFPLIVPTTDTAVVVGETDSDSTEFCARTLPTRDCRQQEAKIQEEEEDDDDDDDASPTRTRQCHRHDHAALLRPLLFDNNLSDKQQQKRLASSSSNVTTTHNGSGQLIVLSSDILQEQRETASNNKQPDDDDSISKHVVLHLPLLVLDPFRRYAKAHLKIQSKILPHAFEVLDRSLYQERRALWTQHAASALVVLHYVHNDGGGDATATRSTVYLAHAGDGLGMVVRWHEGGRAEIVASTQPHIPTLDTEQQRIEEAGGVVRTEENGVAQVFANDKKSNGVDSQEEGLPTARAIGGGLYKFKGVTAVPTVQEIVLPASSSNDDRYFVVAASPSLRVLTEQYVASEVGKALFAPTDNTQDDPETLPSAVSRLLTEATQHTANGNKAEAEMTLIATIL